MAADIDNVEIGVCEVNYKNTDLGHTKGGVTFRYSTSQHEVTVDKYGDTPAEIVLVGERMEVDVPLAEATYANLKLLLHAGSNATSKSTIGGEVGDRLGASGGQLVLHPAKNAANNLADDIVLYNAIVTSDVEIPFMVDSERVINVTFTAIIDETNTDGDMLGLIGDSTT